MNKALVLALIAAAGLAAGCAGNAKSKAARLKNPAPCPNVSVLSDAARAVEFDGDQTIENVAYTAEILSVELSCRYFADEPIKASLIIDLAFGRGGKGLEKGHNYAYWVAVTRSDIEVIEKAEFLIPVEFDKDRNVRIAKEKIDEILIPRKDNEVSGTNFEVVVGLVLTPQQAIFNRTGKSLKFPEL
jgi:hypothetical protein